MAVRPSLASLPAIAFRAPVGVHFLAFRLPNSSGLEKSVAGTAVGTISRPL